MPSQTEVGDLIIKTITDKIGEMQPCVVCGKKEWLVESRFAPVVTSSSPTTLNLKRGSKVMPLLPLICGHCGNTHFLNLRVLGFDDLSRLKIDDDNAKTSPAAQS